MKPLTKTIFAAIGMALGFAVLVMLIISDEPDMRVMIMLLALGMASQGISMVDQIGEKEEKDKE